MHKNHQRNLVIFFCKKLLTNSGKCGIIIGSRPSVATRFPLSPILYDFFLWLFHFWIYAEFFPKLKAGRRRLWQGRSSRPHPYMPFFRSCLIFPDASNISRNALAAFILFYDKIITRNQIVDFYWQINKLSSNNLEKTLSNFSRMKIWTNKAAGPI